MRHVRPAILLAALAAAACGSVEPAVDRQFVDAGATESDARPPDALGHHP